MIHKIKYFIYQNLIMPFVEIGPVQVSDTSALLNHADSLEAAGKLQTICLDRHESAEVKKTDWKGSSYTIPALGPARIIIVKEPETNN